MGVVRSKSMSLDQILEKPCDRSKDHSFDPIFIKLAQNVYLVERMDPIENGLSQVKKLVTRSNLRKTLFTLWSPLFQCSLSQTYSEYLS